MKRWIEEALEACCDDFEAKITHIFAEPDTSIGTVPLELSKVLSSLILWGPIKLLQLGGVDIFLEVVQTTAWLVLLHKQRYRQVYHLSHLEDY